MVSKSDIRKAELIMKIIKKIMIVLCIIVCIVILTACSSKKTEPMKIYTDIHSDEYLKAAGNDFSKVSSEPMASLDRSATSDARYIVVISDNEEILEQPKIEGKNFTINVFDDGEDQLKVAFTYLAGTTENSVVKGAIVSGEVSATRTVDITPTNRSDSANPVYMTDISKRAQLLFHQIGSILESIEEK